MTNQTHSRSLLISIIIPTFNAGETINACLESIATQEFKDFEVVIVDGLSLDNTLEKVRAYAESGLAINIIAEQDAGIYDAMNKGISHAKGGWLYFLGADDQLANAQSLYDVSKHLNPDEDLVYGNVIWMPGNLDDSGIKSHSSLLQTGINHQRIFYNRYLIKKYGGYHLEYMIAADYAYNIKLFCDSSIRKKYVDVPVAIYHAGGFSAGKMDMAFWRDWKETFLQNFKPYLGKKEIYRRLSWYCWNRLEEKQYLAAAHLFLAISFYTGSFTFIKHTLSQLKKQLIRR